MIKTLFMGRKRVASDCLRWLHSSCPHIEVVGVLTDSHLSNSPTATAARELGLPVLDIQSAESFVVENKIEFGLSILYWRKLKGSLLFSDSRYGCINFHPAPLPTYKGCAGYNLAILNGLSEWSTSCHYVDQEIDTGSIIDVASFPINTSIETAFSLEKKTLDVMEHQFKSVITSLRSSISGRLPSIPNIGGVYTSRSQMEDMKRILPGDDPETKARAFYFPPYDGAWVEINGQRLTVIPTSVLRTLGDPDTSSLFSPPIISDQ